jgi:hypothetical protein
LILKINFEIAQIETLLKTHELLLQMCRQKTPDSTELAAIGTILHSFYNGIEKIFLFIAKDFDESVPGGEKWHRELIRMMAPSTKYRDAILSADILEIIIDYLGFRHYFRHSYDFQLDWGSLKEKTLNPCQELGGN